MREQDKRAVESMCRCGLSLEGILESFPGFPKDEITAIYEQMKGTESSREEAPEIKMNCS